MPANAKTFLLVMRNPYPGLIRGCVAISATKLVVVNWVIFIVMEGGTPTPLILAGLTF